MITIVAEVSNDNDFERLKSNLDNNLPDLYERPDVVCVVRNEELFLAVRDYLLENELVNEHLVVLQPKGNPSDLITDKNKYLFIMNCREYISKGTIQTLLDDYLDHPKAGFITGRGSKALKIKNVYDDSSEKLDIPIEGVVEIDHIPFWGLLTRTSAYLQYNTDDPQNKQYYGLYLRRQGYINYLDNRAVYD